MEQEEVEKVARRSTMYQFVDNVLYRKRSNGVKLKAFPGRKDWSCWQRYTEAYVSPT